MPRSEAIDEPVSLPPDTEGQGLTTAEVRELLYAVPILTGSLKSLKRLTSALEIDPPAVAQLETDAEILGALIDSVEEGKGTKLRPELRRVARIALRLLHGRVASLKDLEEKVGSDYMPTTRRLGKLDRMVQKLEDQRSLALDPPDADVEED